MSAPYFQPPLTELKRRRRLRRLATVGVVLVTTAAMGAVVGAVLNASAANSPQRQTTQSTTPVNGADRTDREPRAERPVMKPITYKGVGDRILEIEKPDAFQIGYAKIRYTGLSNFAVQTVGDRVPELLVNVVGGYAGTVAFDLDDMNADRLRIVADGKWSVKLLPMERLRYLGAGEKISGHGDDVLLYSESKDTIAKIRYDGRSRFAVSTFGGTGAPDRLVDQTGPYTGKRLIPTTSLVIVTADGDWSIRTR